MASIFTMITKISRFASDAAGLEKTLRLLQGLSQITIANIYSPKTVAPWLQARKQFALGRRYLRFFKFIEAFGAASRTWCVGSLSDGVSAVLQLDAMEVYPTPWAPTILLEAHRFWFYSLTCSLSLSLLQISQPRVPPSRNLTQGTPASTSTTTPSGSHNQKSTGNSNARNAALPWPLLRQLLTDACDILIPGSVTGWARTSPAIVGAATVVSTLLASQEIWERVQRSAASLSASSSSVASVASSSSASGVRRPGRRKQEEGYELRERKGRV